MSAISISKLKKKYIRGIKQEIIALKELDLEIEPGEIFGFLGPNGAGKSTTIKILLDIIRPTSGKAKIFDMDVGNHLARNNIGYLPETPAFYDYLTAKEILWFVGKAHNLESGKLQERIKTVLKLVNLEEVENVRIRKFSKGMVQRIGLAQAIVHDPALLILDEPTSGLDPLGRKLVADLLLNLKKEGKTIFFSSHILHDVETICDRVAMISKGELRFQGRISDFVYQSTETFDLLLQLDHINRLSYYAILKNKGLDYAEEGGMLRIKINKSELWPTLEFIKEKNLNLFAIEPQRKKLEDVFLKNI
jgi:ABC-2 type transport system ATP-binding protein